MEKFIVNGGKKLKGTIPVSGAKNVALKALVAACLTNEKVVIENIPLISDFFVMSEIIEELGGEVIIRDHQASIQIKKIVKDKISLEKAAEVRTSLMFLAPLLVREGRALIPNPGGCRIGARPIDRVVAGLRQMDAVVDYDSKDGYFHAKTEGLKGVRYRFDKNTHTGTETLILVATKAEGRTILENAACEPEVDELIDFLNSMGADIKRVESRTIVINGVKNLHGSQFRIKPDRNEIATLAMAALITEGDITVRETKKENLTAFLDYLEKAGGGFEEQKDGLRFYYKNSVRPTHVTTAPYPGFMTDWQGPWAVLMTKAEGISIIHEAVYENRFAYIEELKKMGANILPFNPKMDDPKSFYNFNLEDDKDEYFHAIKIYGPTTLHNGIVTIFDLRAGATLVLAAIAAKGESVIFGVEHLDRGYEKLDQRLNSLGADIKRVNHE